MRALVTRWWDGELGAAGRLLSGILAPAELAFRGAVAVRNLAFDRGLLPSRAAPVPVVSIGNIGVGGTGKTPFAQYVAGRLRDGGARVAILHGGYAEDEPELHRQWSADVAVFVGRDRAASSLQATAGGATVLVLDDAFQHRRLRRSLDVVLVSAERWLRTPRRLLPRGPWREPVTALGRADLVVVTRRTAAAEEAARVGAELRQHTDAAVAQAFLEPAGWLNQGAASGPPSGDALAVAGVAEPAAFEANARQAGATVDRTLRFPDHHAYTSADVAAILTAARGHPVATTAKDWVKLRHHLDASRVWILTQRVRVEDGAAELDARLQQVLDSAERGPGAT